MGYLLYEKVAMCANCARMKTFLIVLYLVLLKSPQLEKTMCLFELEWNKIYFNATNLHM